MTEVNIRSLRVALNNMLNDEIKDVSYEMQVLQGGTVGDVVKLSGNAITEKDNIPFSLVLKTQKKWDRHKDEGCWRREYEIYKNGLVSQLTNTIKLPKCYLLEESEDITWVWMEFIEGRSGSAQLNADELAEAIYMLAKLQADFHLNGNKDIPYLRNFPAIESSFDLWWNELLPYINEPIEGFPEKIRNILIDYSNRSQDMLKSLKKLPMTLCQGDVHHDNLIFKDMLTGTDIYLIDWDSAGYGYIGEDAVDILMEAFLYSDRDVSLLIDYKERIIRSFCEGIRSGGLDFDMSDALVKDIFAYAWGFRIAKHYLYYKEEALKRRCIDILEIMLL